MKNNASADLLRQADLKQQTALDIVAELGLLELWGRHGRPVIVGAVAHGLVCAPDIDMEIYCPAPLIADGFQVLAQCAARSARVASAYFENHLASDDNALYWQLKYRQDNGVVWKIDMWSAADDYALPRGEHIVGPMQEALTPQARQTILALKQELVADPTTVCLSIDLYRAVLDDGVDSMAGLRTWLARGDNGGLSAWRPRPAAG